MVNSLQWGLDNWIYGVAGSDGGTVKSSQKPDAPAVSLRNRGFRFKPDVPGSLEPTSGGGQYGLTADDYQRWFTATNSQHLRQIVLPDHYLKRNPFLPVSAVTIDIPEHGAAAQVFRISPFEPWRVERTTRRAGGAGRRALSRDRTRSRRVHHVRVQPAHLHGGPVPQGVLREQLRLRSGEQPDSPRIAPGERRGLHAPCAPTRTASSSPRPTTGSVPCISRIGPDGAIYVLDFYREVIETPLSLPDDIKKQLNLESRGRGRIWRIAPKDFKAGPMPDLTKLTPAQLADELASANSTRRLMAHRLLVERQEKASVARIHELLSKTADKPAVLNLLWTLEGLGELKAADVIPAFKDADPGVRENALRLIEPFLNVGTDEAKTALGSIVYKLVDDTSPRVRFQLAFTARHLPAGLKIGALMHLLWKDEPDQWIQTAALSSADGAGADLLAGFQKSNIPPSASLFRRIAAMVGARGNEEEVAKLVGTIASGDSTTARLDVAMLDGLGQGMRNAKVTMSVWLANPPTGSEKAAEALRDRFTKSADALRNETQSAAARVGAANLLASAPFDVAGPALAEALSPSSAGDVQLAAVRALAAHTDARVAEMYLKNWKGYGPAVRAVVLDAMLARPDRVLALLTAIEKKTLAASDLSQAQVQQLKTHPNAAVKRKAEAVLKQSIDADRAKVVADFAKSLELKGDPKVGKTLFQKHCSACHKLDGVGHEVGPNLLAVLGNKSGDDLLVSVFDPNREVDPRYRTYQVGTADERVLTGIVVTETPTSITLRRAEGVEEVILRANLALFRATTLSLMPVGLEKEFKHQDVADLFAYLRSAGK